tara:strand:+ start:6933 stop:7118 length:186 start_codon:yes stop_codon:yes gene_type:complete
MYIYTLCQFEYGYEGTFYQESGMNGEGLIRFTDLEGNTINLEGNYGYNVVDNNSERPTWAQ